MTLAPEAALDVTARLASAAACVAALEMFAARAEFGPRGVFNSDAITALVIGRMRWRFAERLVHLLLVMLIGSAATVIIVGPYVLVGRIALALLVVGRALVRARRLLGGDGAEQITTLTLIAVLLAVAPEPSQVRTALAVAFIAAQLTLSYTTAGIAKLASPAWRRGSALVDIMRTEGWGHPALASLLTRYRGLSALLGWSVVIFETGFPLFLIGPYELAVAGLTIGLTFHVACALTMGLNSFLVAFPATFPCVMIAAAWVSPYW